MREFMAINQGAVRPGRVRILLASAGRELCGLPDHGTVWLRTSTMSKHLSILHHAGLIQSRKTERWVHYRLPDPPVPVAVRQALDWVHRSLAKTAEAKADASI